MNFRSEDTIHYLYTASYQRGREVVGDMEVGSGGVGVVGDVVHSGVVSPSESSGPFTSTGSERN